MQMSRRQLMVTAASAAALPSASRSDAPLRLAWDDLLPPGVPYFRIVAQGLRNRDKDIWRPVFDANAMRLNPALDDVLVALPGFMLPIDLTSAGVTSFVLVPYAGACIHTPPPPANQLVFVTAQTPWRSDDMWDPVLVTGQMRHDVQSTDVAKVGYALDADTVEIYEW